MPKKKTSGKKKSVSRVYDNTSRAKKSAETQASILEAYIALLVERSGEDVQIAEVAKRCGVTQRTVFRFFKDKKSMQEALDIYLLGYLQKAATQMEALDFVGFGKNAFEVFDRHKNLTTAYVISPFGQQTRSQFRKKLNTAMIARIQSERKLEMNPERLKRLALVTSLVNAKIWYDLRSDFGFTGADMREAMEWALKTLLEKC